MTIPIYFQDFNIEIRLGTQVSISGQSQYQSSLPTQPPAAVIKLVKCGDCAALLDPNETWKHQTWHEQVVRLKR